MDPEQEPTKIPDLLELWRDLNRPSAARFAAALKKRGIPARAKDIEEIFSSVQGSKQIFAQGPRYVGHITADSLDDKWMADTIVNAAMPSSYKGTKWTHVLVVQDVFSRYAWVELMTSAMQITAAFDRILKTSHRKPRVLVTDEDPGFKAKSFEDLCEKDGITHVFKVGRNDIATVDRLIFTIRRALAEHMAESGEVDWASQIQKVVKGYNAMGHPRLMGSAPKTCLETRSCSSSS
jgi:transposase InsO family protein